MTGTALARVEHTSSFDLAPQAWSLAQRICNTEFVPQEMRGKPEKVLASFLKGHEVGFAPMASLALIHVINGRAGMYAEGMRALVLQAGHDFWIEEQSITRCTVGGQRRGSERQTKMTWTADDSKRAGLAGNHQKYPQAMYLARATAALCRAIFPDVLSGLSYSVEELTDGFDDAPTTIGGPATTSPAGQRRQAPRQATRGSVAPAQTEPAPALPRAAREAPLPGEEDDEAIDGEVVDEYEGPDQDLAARSYSGPQIIAMRCQEVGLDRDDKLAYVSDVLGREVTTTKDLSPAEITMVLKHLDTFAPIAGEADGQGEPPDEGVAAPSQTTPEVVPPPSAPPRRRAAPATAAAASSVTPAPSLDQWTGDNWRAFLKARSVKVTELLKEASRLGKERGVSAPATLDDVTASGMADDLVGFVEDLAMGRKG
jgi:hypothetical protein